MSNSKTEVLLFVICSLVFICHLCFGICHSYAQDKIVAIVNNDVITQKDLNDFVNFMRMQLSREMNQEEMEKKIESLKLDLLDRLIEDKLILQEAKKNDSKIEIQPKVTISIKPEESRVKARIAEIKKRYTSESEFQEDLARQGLVQADIETKIREQLLMYNIIEYKIRNTVVVRPDEVTEFYNKNKKEFVSGDERQVEIISLQNQDLAKTFAYSYKAGQKLEDLAVRYPITVDKMSVKQKGELRSDIEDAVFKLGIGEVSDPVKIDDKYYVFKLDNIIPSRQLGLSEVQDKIHALLFERKMQEKLTNWLDELKGKSYIKILQS
jgi:parvulin-like peptidyl-prolyl isomerase